MASHPKRSRTLSTARSTTKRTMPFFSAGTAILVLKSKREFQLRCRVVLKIRHRDRQQRDGLLVRVIRQDVPHQLLGDLGQGCRRRNRRRQRGRAGDRARFSSRPACGADVGSGPSHQGAVGRDRRAVPNEEQPAYLLWRPHFTETTARPSLRIRGTGAAL